MKKTEVNENVNRDVDWNEAPLQRWLGTITRKGTRYQYKYAFKVYALYTGLTASELVDEALEDSKRDPREKRDIVMTRLIGFYNWQKNEYEVKKRGRGSREVVKVGVSDKLAYMRVNAVRSFYGTFDIYVRLKGRRRLPRPRVENKRIKVNAEQVKTLINHARTPRDRAIILTLFQSGMDVSTLCSLSYGDVRVGLESKEHPLKLDLYRQKSGTEFYTYLGRDAVDAIRTYLADAEWRDLTFTNNTSLFLKERRVNGHVKGLTTNLVQNMMKAVAVKAGFVDEKNNGQSFNPLGPHALRESFGSIMINSGVPDTIVDFWLGHSIGEMAEAYKSMQAESLKRMYLEREYLLSVSTPGLDEKALEEKISVKVDERAEALMKVVEKYQSENLELRGRVARVELENTDLKRRLQLVERWMEETMKLTN